MGNLLAAEMELRSVHASFTKLGVTLRDVLEGGLKHYQQYSLVGV